MVRSMQGGETGTIAPLAHGDPSVLGPWQLLGRLGAGGMGIVYLGRDGERLAAVKAVSPGLAGSPAFIARFRREVSICRRVTGPQVAELLGADTIGPQPWLAIRFIPGPTLDVAISRHGPMTEDTLKGFALAVLEALREIHGAGVIHRDLKPANVILTPETPVIIDFGIAGATDVTPLTATGSVLGSAGWMSPEQILGEEITEAADVFSWAALVAYAATGRPPFGVGRPEALTYRVVHGSADLEGLPSALLPLVTRSLSVAPGDRPRVEDLLAELVSDRSASVADAIHHSWRGDEAEDLAGLGVRPRAASALDKKWRRRPGAVATVALLALALVGGGLAWQLKRPASGGSWVGRGATAADSKAGCSDRRESTGAGTGSPGKARTAVAASPVAIASDGHDVWVVSGAENLLTELDPVTLDVVDILKVSGQPEGVALTDRDVWVTESRDDMVNAIDRCAPDNNERFNVGGHPEAVVALGSEAWFTMSNDSNQSVGRIVGGQHTQINLGRPADGIAATPSSVWVAAAGAVMEIDPTSTRIRRTIDLHRSTEGIAARDDGVWVTNPDENAVTRIDPATGTFTSIPVGTHPRGIVATSDAVWVTNQNDGTVTHLDSKTNAVLATVKVGRDPIGIAADERWIWVANHGSNDVTRIPRS